MKSSTGRWVSGDDFFDREGELALLESRVRDGNHLVMTGQRRMGKTSILQELGRRLEPGGWVFLFADVEADRSEEDLIASLARAIHPVTPITSRFLRATGRRFRRLAGKVDQITAHQFAVRFRGGLDSGNWRRHGENLIAHCAAHRQPVLMVIDEIPIFLARLLRQENGRQRVDEFLSWLRAVFQKGDAGFPVLILSGSIGLAPLVERLGIPDRINYLDPIRLRPWNLETSVQCFEKLMTTYELSADDGVALAVYEHLGIGIPQYVQSFFACLRDYVRMHGRDRIALDDVAEVYRTELLGPSGQIDLAHYETRLRDGLGDAHRYRLAMEILAEAAVQGTFTTEARRQLEKRHSKLVEDPPRLVTETLAVLAARGQNPPGIRAAMHPRWPLRFTCSRCKANVTFCESQYTFGGSKASLCVAPRANSSAIHLSSRLASPAPHRSRCSGGFIHGLLVHDDYLEPHPDGHRFRMNLLRDWWRARFRHHSRPLAKHRAIGFRENDTP